VNNIIQFPLSKKPLAPLNLPTEHLKTRELPAGHIELITNCIANGTHNLVIYIAVEPNPVISFGAANEMAPIANEISRLEKRLRVQHLAKWNNAKINWSGTLGVQNRYNIYNFISCHVLVLNRSIFRIDRTVLKKLAAVNRVAVISEDGKDRAGELCVVN